jgi:phosphatidylglycerophosphate synthase
MPRTTRVDDGFYSTFVLRPLSEPLTAWSIRHQASPNTITIASLLIAAGAAGLFAFGQVWAYLAGAVLLQVSLVVDCVDGDVARATGRTSRLGAWLDASTDRVKEGLAYAGLAIGAAVNGSDLWLVAITLLALQAVRHVSDYTFATMRGTSSPSVATTGPSHWLRKVAYLPIGERWLILSIGVILGGPAVALWALLIASAVSLAFSTIQRIRRTGALPPASGEIAVVALQADHGPLLFAARLPARSRWSWIWPPLERIVEYVVLIAIAWPLSAVGRAAAFAWLLVVVFHHYDVLYRAIQGRAIPRWINVAGLGFEGRIIVLILAYALVWTVPLLAWGAAWGGLLFVIIASVQWIRALKETRA